jgi:hypothetical protein
LATAGLLSLSRRRAINPSQKLRAADNATLRLKKVAVAVDQVSFFSAWGE